MTRAHTKTTVFIKYFFSILCLSFLTPSNVFAQSMMGGTFATCSMCNNMGWGGMTFGVLVMISMIIAFVALAVFLIRRSRSSH